uniref:Uncharacterized protein n=1 Tax=Anguilla anguilla TaxID=7936 RepID=A0A0E9THV0_ANGAN
MQVSGYKIFSLMHFRDAIAPSLSG